MTATATVSIVSPTVTVKALDSGISYTGSAPVPVSLAGDVSGTAAVNIINTTLATVNGAPGTYGDAAHVPVLSVNAKGLLYATSHSPIAIPAAQITDATSAGRAVLTATDATAQTALLNAMTGDSGAGGTKGLVPAPAAGTAAAGKYLKADGTWAVPPGTGAGITQITGDATAGPGSGSQAATLTTTGAGLNLPSGTAPASPNNGDIWFDGSVLKMQIGGVTKTFTLI